MSINAESQHIETEGVHVMVNACKSAQFGVGEAAWVNLEAGL